MLVMILLISIVSDFTISIVNADTTKEIDPLTVATNPDDTNMYKDQQIDKINHQIIEINKEIQENDKVIAVLEKQMDTTQTEMNVLENEIMAMNEKIEKRDEVFKERARTYQESGGNISYIEVVLGSSDFSDFIERVDTVSTIVQADKDLIKQQNEEINELENKQQLLENKLNQIANNKNQINQVRLQIIEKEKQYEQIIAFSERDRNEINLDTAQQASDTPDDIPASKTIGSGNINEIITAGYKYIGNSVYVFGGGRTEKDIVSGRFDCSSFVHWAFGQVGIEVGTTTDTIKNNGRQVSTSELRPGDLVFFDTYKKDGHVGIYLGNDKFIGSQSSTGVAIADMSSGYWKDRFNGRIIRIVE